MMTDRAFHRLFGNEADDPGCEASFAELDQYAETVLRGEDATARYAHLIAHVQNCPACLEDTEGLLAALRALESPPPAR